MNDRTKLLLFWVVGTALFIKASLVHACILVSGFDHVRAMVAKGAIGGWASKPSAIFNRFEQDARRTAR